MVLVFLKGSYVMSHVLRYFGGSDGPSVFNPHLIGPVHGVFGKMEGASRGWFRPTRCMCHARERCKKSHLLEVRKWVSFEGPYSNTHPVVEFLQ